MSQGLALRQTQSLTLTPQLLQAIRLLQMSALEVEQLVAGELDANPLLAVDTESDGGDAPVPAAASVDDGEPIESSGAAVSSTPVDRPPPLPAGIGGQFDADAFLASVDAGETSLWSRLESRIEAHFRDRDQAIALALLAALDPTGYLAEGTGEVAARLGVAEPQILAVLEQLQQLAPPGVFARSLAECLALQLAAVEALDPPMLRLLDHLDLLAAHRLPALALRVGCDADTLRRIIARLRTLDPKPGLAFRSERPAMLVPDLEVRPARGGGWTVELLRSAQPAVRVDAAYVASLPRLRGEDRRFVAEAQARATWLCRSLDQRAQTLVAVTAAIVRRQEGFLQHGVEALRPLTLREIAEELQIHESTVSRAVANKGLTCPRGLFELRFFFSTALKRTEGDETLSSSAVRQRIRRLIDGEDPAAPLSDDALVAILEREGIAVARRTVAKYRDGLRIPSSHHRRRARALAS